jgi:6-phosphogluconate dehydrogenase
MAKTTIGIIGLGKMGGNLALQALEKGYAVAGYSQTINPDLQQAGIQLAETLPELVQKLPSPRVIFIYIPAGKAVDQLLDQLSDLVSPGDILVDGGNSYWGDSIRRAEKLKAKGIYLVDCGTSGGVEGARNGACFMAGGDPEAIKIIGPILKELAVENGYLHTGASGSGHFVKLVHNGIEFGMLQAIGEGMALLSAYRDDLDVSAILKVWNHGSVIRSWLIELMDKVYTEKQGFEKVPSYIEDTGEVNWLVADALRMEIPVPVISQSVMQLFASRETNHIADKAIAMMRHGFGGHPFGEDAGIKHERKTGKVENEQTRFLFNRPKEG